MKIVQITDTHIFEDPDMRFESCDTRASFEAVFAEIRSLGGVDLIVGTGDMSMQGGSLSYRFLSSFLSRCGIPFLSVPGNHDEPNVASRAANFNFLTDTTMRDFGRWRLHFLNTRKKGHEQGEISAKGLAALSQNILSAEKMSQIIFMHHPPLDVGSVWLDNMKLGNSVAFWKILKQSQSIKGVFCGHVHQDNEITNTRVRVITTPSTCVQFKRHSQVYEIESLNAGFRVIELQEDGTFFHRVVRLE
jgi:Icc protein